MNFLRYKAGAKFSLSGRAGLDLYEITTDGEKYLKHFPPSEDGSGVFAGEHIFKEGLTRNFTLYMPSYTAVLELYVVIDEGSVLKECVYHCDNNVVDHQEANIEFENGVTVAFYVCGFAEKTSRSIRIMGSHGEIVADLEANSIEVRDFVNGNKEKITINPYASSHSGGDHGFINSALSAIRGEREDRSSAQESVESHLMVFAAEKSRLEGKLF